VNDSLPNYSQCPKLDTYQISLKQRVLGADGTVVTMPFRPSLVAKKNSRFSLTRALSKSSISSWFERDSRFQFHS
jgi:hypothetical protein